MIAAPRYAVFGHPVAHSLSPRLHALFAAEVEIRLQYAAIDAPPGDFARSARGFLAEGGRGANVTLPHKAAAFTLADVATERADRLGVANVLTVLPTGRIEADSNDGAGMLADLKGRHGCDPRGLRVLLLGAGGAACAAAFALLDAGVAGLALANRTPARAEALAARLAEPGRATWLAWPALSRRGPYDLIVNATSAGVNHVALQLPPQLAGTATIAYDLSYGAGAEPFMAWARTAGCAAAYDGLGMLVETAAASFERWHGVRPDTGAALRSLRVRA